MPSGKTLRKTRRRLNRAVSRRRTDPTAWYDLAEFEFFHGPPELAEKYLRRCLALDPDHARAIVYLGGILVETGRVAEAEVLMTRGVRVHPDDHYIVGGLATIMRITDRHDDSERLNRRAVELAPSDPVALQNLGECLFNNGKDEEAERVLRRALDIDPNLAQAWFNLGLVLHLTERFEGAEEAYRRTAILDPNNPKPKMLLHDLLVMLGRHDEAALARFADMGDLSSDEQEYLRELWTYFEEKLAELMRSRVSQWRVEEEAG